MYKKLNIQIATQLSLDELVADTSRTKNFISNIANKTWTYEVVLSIGDNKFVLSNDFKELLGIVNEIFNTVYISQDNPFILRNKYISELADFGLLSLKGDTAVDVINGNSELKAEIPSYILFEDSVFKKFLAQFHSVDSTLNYFFNDCDFDGVLLHGATYLINKFSIPNEKKFLQSKDHDGLFERFSWVEFWQNPTYHSTFKERKPQSVIGFSQRSNIKELTCAYDEAFEEVSYINEKESKKALKSRIEK